jgi:ribosomal protein S18 acetylase RimI-like enzyme
MWVAPAARGAGLADLLISTVIEHARAAGAEQVTLWVAVGNARAHAFYRRAGFRPTGRRQLYHRSGAGDLDEVELARAIDGGPSGGAAARSDVQHGPQGGGDQDQPGRHGEQA